LISAISITLEKASFSFDNYHKLPNNKPHTIDFNRLNIKGIDAKISNFSFFRDTLRTQINNLALIDSSGFWIQKLSGSFLICNGLIKIDRMSLQTPNSKVFANFSLHYKDATAFQYFGDSLFFKSKIYNSSINTKDIAFFLKQNGTFENKLKLKVEINGCLNHFVIKDLAVSFGAKSKILAEATIKDITHPKLMSINSSFKDITSNNQDIRNFQLPNNNHIKIPQELSRIGSISAIGDFNGTIDNFASMLMLKSDAGSLNCKIKWNTINKKVCYQASLETLGFDVSLLAPTSGLKKISLHTEINGSGITKKDVDFKISGNIDHIEYKNYVFNNSKIDGNYANKAFFGHIIIDDPLLFLDFNGSIDYSKKVPKYIFTADVEHAHLVDLQLINRHPSSLLSAHLNATIEGFKLDDFVGEIALNQTKYFESGREYFLNNLNIVSSFSSLGYRSIELKSDWMDASANGKYEFSDVGVAFTYILRKYLPSYAPEKLGVDKLFTISNTQNKTPQNNTVKNERRFLSFDINVKDSDPISALFVPTIKAKGKTTISGFLNTITQHLEFHVGTDSLLIGNLSFQQVDLKGKSKDSLLNITLDCNSFNFSKKDSINLTKIHFASSLKNDSLIFSLLWHNNNNVNTSLVNGRLKFAKSPIITGKLSSLNLIINDSIWLVDPDNSFIIDVKHFGFNHLRFYSNDKQIVLNGVISGNPDDIFKVKLVNINLSQFDPFMNHRNFDLDGIANGEVELSQVFDKFSIIVNLKIASLGFNGQKLGNATVVSAWDNRKNGLYVNIDVLYRGNIGEAKPVTIQGYFYPNGGILDMQADLLNFKLKVIEPYLKTLFYRVDGLATGKVNIIGTINRPQVAGKIKLMHSVFGVNFLNTEYSINQEIEMVKNRINFDSVTVYDTRNNIAIINGYVSHQDYKNFKLDLNVKVFNFMGLNTTRAMNSMFFGKAFGTGAVHIYGTAPNIQIDAQVETNENTEISVPISFNTVVDKSSFINFISKQTHEVTTNQASFVDMGLKMNFLFNVTPEAKFHIFLDPSTGGSLHGSGSGSIRLNINTNGDFNMYGTYTISKGQYEMKLKDVVTKKFEIESGGTIQWNGNPSDADIDIKAVFPTNASLSSLTSIDSSNTSSYNRKVKVLSVLKLTGKLLNPQIRFGIDLPNADYSTKTSFYNLIDTTNDQNMIRQTFSLLVLGRFESSTTQYGNVVGDGVGMSAMELVSNQLGNFLSQYTKDVNFAVNYKLADQVTSEELQIAVSKQLFNDRVTIDGNLSAGGQNKYIQNTNNVVGDIIVEVKLTPDGRWKTKVYNIANTNEYTFQNAPYVQGIGFIYRVDFNKVRDIFKKKSQ
jgi:hypothetical protein